MNLFYTSSIRKSADQEEFSLEGKEAIHAGKVLRVSEGDTLYATDGKGMIYKGIVSSITRRNIHARVTGKTFRKKPVPDVTIAIGNIKKRDRLEFAVEKAVELGVAGIIIFQAGYSEKKRVRLDRLETAALSAMKQSLRAWLPAVSEAENLEMF
jgi:16S rRNA (uracil1498-N3)-methyltransferase